MRRAVSALFILLLLPGAAPAQQVLDAEAFDALTLGKTFYFSSDGRPYGAEEYLDDRRVRWSFLDGQCIEGRWWQEEELICFVYEDDTGVHCWSFRQEGGGLTAQSVGDATGRVLYEVRQSEKPLHCLGPKIGV